MKKEIVWILRGNFYCNRCYGCYTLKQAMEEYGVKRSQIKDWWKE